MPTLILDIRRSAQENAQEYFAQAKKARKKLEGARIVIQKAHEKLDSLQAKRHEEDQARTEKVHARKRKQAWFEKFRWFISSEGFLVVGGRDATTNEIIVKKHTESHDVLFHTDMAGSPFFVIKTEGRTPGEATLQEVANATFSFSRALKLGLYTANVFWVKPDQVSKEPNAGEFLPKGAFVIRGKTNYIAPKIDLAIGITEDGAIMCGPLAAVKRNTQKSLALKVKKEKSSDAAKKIRAKLGGDLDEILRALPPGEVTPA